MKEYFIYEEQLILKIFKVVAESKEEAKEKFMREEGEYVKDYSNFPVEVNIVDIEEGK